MSPADPPPAPAPPRPTAFLVSLLVGAAIALVVPVALTWPLLPCLRDGVALTPFTGSTAYQIEVQLAQVLGERPWTREVGDVGFPYGGIAVLVGWLPTVLLAPLRHVLAAPALFSVVLLISPALSALPASWALRKAAGIDGVEGGLLAAAFALSPFVLGALAAGATEKLAVGVFAAFLAAILSAGEGWRGVVLPAVVVLLSGFVDPSLMVHFPVVGVAAGGLALGRGRGRGRGALLRLVLAAALCGVALLPVREYFAGAHDVMDPSGRVLVYGPLARLAGPEDQPGPLAPIATLGSLLRPLAPRELEPRLYYVTYVGWPVLALMLAALVRGAPGRGWSLLLALGGLLLAFGPRLAQGDAWVVWRGGPVTLPAAWVERLVPEIGTSGSWYRAMGAAWLGIVLLLAAGVARLPGRWRLAGAAGGFAAIVGGGLYATAFLWPMGVGPVAGRATLLTWAADPYPGAVMDLPLIEARPPIGGHSGCDAVMAATLHHRATTALPRSGAARPHPAYAPRRSLSAALREGDPAAARARLVADGYRYVAYRDWAEPPADEIARLTEVLGPARVDTGLHWWDLRAP